MRFVNRSWLLFAGCALTGAAVAACSASAGDGDLAGDDSGSPDDSSSSDSSGHHDSSTHDASSALDAGGQDSTTAHDSSTADTSSPDTSSAVDSAVDTGTVDASEAGLDSGADADAGLPPVGSPCSPVNSIQSEACGACGTESRVCLGLDGGSPVWQDWGTCNNQVANGCIPGTTTSAACGLCGTQTKVCQSSCTYAVGACTGQPMNACTPGAINYQPGLSCDAGGREQTCQSNCTWSNYGNCIVFDGGSPLGLTIPMSVGSPAATKIITLDVPVLPKLGSGSTSGACVLDSTTTGVNDYITIYNPTNLSATISVWLSGATSGTFDSIMATYPDMNPPPASRTACTLYNDDCFTSPCVGSDMSGLVGTSRPVLAAGTTITLYVGTYSASTTARDVQVNVTTDMLQ